MITELYSIEHNKLGIEVGTREEHIAVPMKRKQNRQFQINGGIELKTDVEGEGRGYERGSVGQTAKIKSLLKGRIET